MTELSLLCNELLSTLFSGYNYIIKEFFGSEIDIKAIIIKCITELKVKDDALIYIDFAFTRASEEENPNMNFINIRIYERDTQYMIDGWYDISDDGDEGVLQTTINDEDDIDFKFFSNRVKFEITKSIDIYKEVNIPILYETEFEEMADDDSISIGTTISFTELRDNIYPIVKMRDIPELQKLLSEREKNNITNVKDLDTLQKIYTSWFYTFEAKMNIVEAFILTDSYFNSINLNE